MKKELLVKDSKIINKIIKKFGVCKVKEKYLIGELTIKRCRIYSDYTEVDIIFKGMVYLFPKRNWYPSESVYKLGYTAHYINRHLRRSSFSAVKERMRYLGVDLTFRSEIKKVNLI